MTEGQRKPNRTDRLKALSGVPGAVPNLPMSGGRVVQLSSLLPDGLPEELPGVLQNWLGRLGLLYGVPFNHLVPDARMLPAESIRFFFVDPIWIDRLVDGAFSIGKNSSRDDNHHERMLPAIRRTTVESARTLRSRLRGKAMEEAAPGAAVETPGKNGAGPMTGLLLRSAVVSGWPGLEVNAFSGKDPLEPRRIERLSPDVLIAIFDGVPTRIEINEPSEALHFAVVWDGEGARKIYLRSLDSQSHEAGALIHNVSVTAVMRQEDSRVLDVGKTLPILQSELQKAGENLRDERLSPADFAIQMMNSPEQQVFENDEAKQPKKED
jgi:hypothetical protein